MTKSKTKFNWKKINEKLNNTFELSNGALIAIILISVFLAGAVGLAMGFSEGQSKVKKAQLAAENNENRFYLVENLTAKQIWLLVLEVAGTYVLEYLHWIVGGLFIALIVSWILHGPGFRIA